MKDDNIPDHLKDDPSAPYNIEETIKYPEIVDNQSFDALWGIDDDSDIPEDYDF